MRFVPDKTDSWWILSLKRCAIVDLTCSGLDFSAAIQISNQGCSCNMNDKSTWLVEDFASLSRNVR